MLLPVIWAMVVLGLTSQLPGIDCRPFCFIGQERSGSMNKILILLLSFLVINGCSRTFWREWARSMEQSRKDEEQSEKSQHKTQRDYETNQYKQQSQNEKKETIQLVFY